MEDSYSVRDYVQRHLFGLPIWNELRFWDHYFDYLMEISAKKMANHATLVTTQFVVVASRMVGLGLLDTDMWYMIETIAEKNKLGYEELIRLRGLLSHIQLLRVGYWGLTSASIQSLSYGSHLPQFQGIETQQPIKNSTLGHNWVHNMFRDPEPVKPDISCRKSELTFPEEKKIQTSVRILRGHTGAITALHCVSRREVCDLIGDRDDAGFFISGSTDCMVKIWDPSLRGSELRATLSGHTRPIRAIRSDRSKVVSGSDDLSVIVWDKQTSQLLKVLEGHNAPVSCVRMTGECVVSASLDGTLKMWDTRTDGCVDTIGRCSSAVLCIDYDNYTGILAAAGKDALAKIWDIRASKQMNKFSGHTKWIRSIRLVGDTLLTGSDDWTARMWSVSRGSCDAILPFHTGPILCVEYSPADKGVITGSVDGIIRFWENQDGGMKCIKKEIMHSAPILSISAGDHWLGIGAADNSMSLFQRPQGRLGGFSNTGSKMGGWQLYRTPQRTLASVRCVASDLDRKRICSGGRNGLLHLWEATIKI